MTIRADWRLLWCAPARWAGVACVVGVVIGGFMWADGLEWWNVLAMPAFLAVAAASTLGAVQALIWLGWSGTVTYRIEGDALSAYRGARRRRSVPLARVAELDFDLHATPWSLVMSGWWGYLTPLPRLLVTLNSTDDRWDPSNGAAEHFPAILLAGTDLESALADLRRRLAVPA